MSRKLSKAMIGCPVLVEWLDAWTVDAWKPCDAKQFLAANFTVQTVGFLVGYDKEQLCLSTGVGSRDGKGKPFAAATWLIPRGMVRKVRRL